MTSRLDRLFILLESGSSAVTRRAAAKQIGEVQKLYPHELHTLLNRLIGYLHSTSWDTRIAAAQTVEAILHNVPEWKPELYCTDIKSEAAAAPSNGGANSCSVIKTTPRKAEPEEPQSEEARVITRTTPAPPPPPAPPAPPASDYKERLLSFDDFDLEQILHKGARLIGSEGNEFDVHEEAGGKAAANAAPPGEAAAERLSRQRALLNEKLGLSKAAKLGLALDNMITDEDMRTNHSSYNANEQKVPVEDILKIKPHANLMPSNGQPQLSCREMNRAKRKARQQNNNGGSGGGGPSAGGGPTSTAVSVITSGASASPAASNGGPASRASEEPEIKKAKMESHRQDIFYSLNGPVPDATGMWVDTISWPLENFCARLYMDLFDPKWEVRHGAATALRELINHHSAGAGKCQGMTRDQMAEHHCLWLEDAALRLMCVLCLDRFGDFISDQVVAPVRETCAQVLGTIVKEMRPRKVQQIVAILLKLLKQSEWEVRHGGLLGLRYVFVVRKDLLHLYLPNIINDVLMGLFDAVDDVGAVAAATLIPVASWLPKLLTPAQVSSIVKMLWDLLLDQDELTSACNSFMGLLAAILSLPNASTWIQMEPMATLVPRLWPFLSHSTSSVRMSTLVTLQTLTSQPPVKKEEGDDHDAAAAAAASLNEREPDAKVKQEKAAEGISDSASPLDATAALTPLNFDSKSLRINFGVRDWQWPLLQQAMRHVFQRILVEPLPDIQERAQAVWRNLIENADLGALLHAACPYVSSWICLAMQPPRLAFDPNVLISASAGAVAPSSVAVSGGAPGHPPSRRRNRDDLGGGSAAAQKLYLGGSEAVQLEVRERNYMRARVMAARLLGALSQYLVQPAPGVEYTPQMESPMDCYTKVLMGHLNSRSSVQRTVCGLIIAFWAQADAAVCPGDPKLQEKLRSCVTEYVYYDEVAVGCSRLLQEAYDLIATLNQYKIPVNDFNKAKVLTLDQIETVATTLTANLHLYPLKPKVLDTLLERRRSLQSSYQQTSAEQAAYNISTQAALAGAIVCLRCLPDKLNPVVKPLMESIKREDCELLQQLSAEFLVHLMQQVCDRNPSPNNKILTNLCMLLKSDPEYTPKIPTPVLTLQQTRPPGAASADCVYYGCLTLSQQQQIPSSSAALQRSQSLASTSASSSPMVAGLIQAPTATRGPGRPPLSEVSAREAANAAAVAAAESNNQAQLLAELKQCRTQRLGATCAITQLCSTFGDSLSSKIPVFEQIMFAKIEQFIADHPDPLANLAPLPIDTVQTNELVTALQLIEVAAPHLKGKAAERLFHLLPHFGVLVTHPFKAVRHMVARCIATLAAIDPCVTMQFVVDRLVALLRRIENVIERQGAVEAIERVVDKLQMRIVPYIVLLVVPLLGCMSDPDESVRLLATHCFATLIQLMPLDSRGNCPKSELKSRHLQERKSRDREFLDYLFAPKSIPDYKVPVPLAVELRSYQQAGVNWLWFLNKYNLHGILCDDMGLGKTLQTICILVGDHHDRVQRGEPALPSMVVCPPTLTGHWVYEIEKFLNRSPVLRPLHYVGLPTSREKLRCHIGRCNLVVASYDTVRKDIDYLSTLHWNYCVLDEGHIIKNGKTKSSKAIKMLRAQHRLILSGTPIQNNVLELWSLFDFLMPGFLGTEKQFISRFSRPILASRDGKSSAKEQEAGVLAMEALHRQVLPFLLRRVKEDVLTDLPPKITQDLLCELSPLQERLYEDFSRLHLKTDLQDCLEHLGDGDTLNAKTHIFHALRYLQNVCNHPKLVLTPKHPEYARITRDLQSSGGSLSEIEHSAKLPALKQLLLDCGIGVQNESVSQHRALIFCQLKAMLDIVEKDLLRAHMPTVSYLRLDGTVPASMRQDIVNNFNGDPSIDVLLLTTQVGGLGLNLTGADTVIFVEHDWNPMKDLQAMDRAHRIGQKKVVNVYRLITRKSLEEKIMGLQKFKILTANTVVSSENASLETMATGQLFDLFNLNDSGAKNSTNGSTTTTTTSNKGSSVNAIIENLPELWSENQYDEEYDLSSFVQALNRQPQSQP